MATCAHVSDTLREGCVYVGVGLKGYSGLDPELASELKKQPTRSCRKRKGTYFIVFM